MNLIKNLFFAIKAIKGRATSLFKNVSKGEKYIIITLFIVILICAFLSIREHFFINKTEVSVSGGTYSEGIEGEIRFLMPVLKQNEAEKDADKLIFSSLIKFNQKGEIIPDLAEKWEILDGGKTYKFYLKKALWHDDSPVTASDVVFTLELAKNKEINSPYFDILSNAEIEKNDEQTITLKIKTPLASFLPSLTIPILPKHLLENVPAQELSTSQFAKNPIGSGPFKLEKIEKSPRVTSLNFTAFENYFVKKPYLAKITLKVYQDKEDLKKAFESKKIAGTLLEEPAKINYKVTLPRYAAIFFNLKRIPDENLRKALALAVNREEILKEVSGDPIYFPILPGQLGYKDGEKTEYNQNAAKETLAKAKDRPEELKLVVKDSEENQKVAEMLKAQWEAAGIKINASIEFNPYFDKILEERDYDLLLIGVDQKADSDPYPFWHSNFLKDGYNFSGLEDKEIDKLLEGGRKSMDPVIRQQKYEKFIDIIQKKNPAIFLYRPFYYYDFTKKMNGPAEMQILLKTDRFFNIEEWHLKTKKIKG